MRHEAGEAAIVRWIGSWFVDHGLGELFGRDGGRCSVSIGVYADFPGSARSLAAKSDAKCVNEGAQGSGIF